MNEKNIQLSKNENNKNKIKNYYFVLVLFVISLIFSLYLFYITRTCEGFLCGLSILYLPFVWGIFFLASFIYFTLNYVKSNKINNIEQKDIFTNRILKNIYWTIILTAILSIIFLFYFFKN